MKPTRTILALFIAALALPMSAIGQDDEAVDEIAVVGQKSLTTLRKEVYKAEEEFYSVYNKLNDEKDYQVRCFYEKPTGTRIKNHVCRAKFVTKAYSSHAARNGNDLSRVANQSSNPVFAEKSAKYQAHMESLIAENPELQVALGEYNSAVGQFMSKRDGKSNN